MTVKLYATDPATLAAAVAIQGDPVPDLTTRLIKSATLVNPGNAPVQAFVYMVPKDGAPSPGNAMIWARPIAPGESYPCPELISQALKAGGALYALGAGLTFKHTATDFI